MPKDIYRDAVGELTGKGHDKHIHPIPYGIPWKTKKDTQDAQNHIRKRDDAT